MPIMRVNLNLEHDSGLPEDRTVMTFHFATDANTDGINEEIAERCRDWLVLSPDVAQVNTLYNYLSTAVSDSGHTAKVYDVGATPGSPPDWIEDFDLVGRVPVSTTNLPDEVACCMSYRNESVTAIVPRRRRGRVYFGPLNAGASDSSTTTSPRPHANIGNDLRIAGNDLMDKNDADAVWVVYSRVAAQSFPIERIWTDNAFDTQRRRGVAPTSRTFLPAL